MTIVDAQVHIWAANTPERPWPARHEAHKPQPITAEDLLPYRTAREPPCQTEARNRRTIMRRARSQKNRPLLLAELERRYRETPES